MTDPHDDKTLDGPWTGAFQPSAGPPAQPAAPEARPSEEPILLVPDLPITGGKLQTAHDVARALDVPHGTLLYSLFRSPDDQRYTEFEIPKRTGGTRRISAPIGLVRELQDKLLPMLSSVYAAHPGAHGFIPGRSVVSNATVHADQHLVLNIDLKEFFPTINFGRVRGLFMARPFEMGAAAATVMAQICTFRNGLPQGAPTSPVLSNFIATALDRRLTRLARNTRMRYSRYADDITLSTNAAAFPASIVVFNEPARADSGITCGDTLNEAITACGFAVNQKKIRLQRRHVRQSVTGLVVNKHVNVDRRRIRKLRAMLHAWRKFGLEAAGAEHFRRYGGNRGVLKLRNADKAFRSVVYGQLSYVKMVRGAGDPVFLNLCAQLINLDPNPSKFVRQMVFGADDYEIFISHASEDKAEVARPIFQACQQLGLKAFLDEEHIAWGESFTTKINTALGAARTVLVIVSSVSVSKPWPVTEVNTALSLEVTGEKNVFAVMVGTPDLSKLPLLRGKDYMVWNGDAMAVARELKRVVHKEQPQQPARPNLPPGQSRTGHVPQVPARPKPPAPAPSTWLGRFLGRR